MSAEPEDVEDITSICGGLNINIGTLTKSSIEGMFRAGRKANELNHPSFWILWVPVLCTSNKHSSSADGAAQTDSYQRQYFGD